MGGGGQASDNVIYEQKIYKAIYKAIIYKAIKYIRAIKQKLYGPKTRSENPLDFPIVSPGL